MDRPELPSDDGETIPSQTRTSAPRPATGTQSRPSSQTGTDGLAPGTVLAGRYRIVTLLGRGGMGEVYRADDLTLGQSVALKFLPAELADHPEAADRFRNEVRIARGVSHANVCRVYDLGELDGRLFLSMEYVDGEDLGSLLRRIGRLPADKALEIARRLCAGLAAAHDLGVLHRDLKPSNVMLDGRGQVRLTDFGIAGLAGNIEGAEIRSGTPAYMSPEQLAGREVTVRSDIYSLGLLLYEIFTGKRPFESDTIPGMLRARQVESPVTPTTLVRDLDPAIESVILRCLDANPARRPASALAVAAALPGGDPLAAALAAGETPSPELVAAAGAGAALKPKWALLLLAVVVAGLGVHAAIAWRLSLIERLNPEYSGEMLAVKARELMVQLGYSKRPVDTAWGFYIQEARLRDERKQQPKRLDWDRLLASRPSLLSYWYRESASPLTGLAVHNDLLITGSVDPNDPPPIESGMAIVRLDIRGRLLAFEAIPPQKMDPGSAAPAVDWTPLFRAAAIDPSTLQTTEPLWNSLAASDVRQAWSGTWPGTRTPLRVEAAALRGKPVYFSLMGPWTTPYRMPDSDDQGLLRVLLLSLLGVLTGGGVALVARRNLKLGRGDRRGASRLAVFAFLLMMATWACQIHVTPGAGLMGIFFLAIVHALFVALLVWAAYLAMEPVIRRRWPHIIISWTSLLGGGYRDAVVGRDILYGMALSVAWSLVPRIVAYFLDPGEPALRALESLDGTRAALGHIVQSAVYAIRNGMLFSFLLVVIGFLVRRKWLAIGTWSVIMSAASMLGGDQHMWVNVVLSLLVFGLIALTTIHLGMLPLVVTYFVVTLTLSMRATLDFSAWHFTGTLWAPLGLLALAGWAFRISLGTGSLLPKSWME